jgi:hypothetical protein
MEEQKLNESHETAYKDADWNQIVQDGQAFVNAIIKFWFAQKDENR